MGVFHIVNKMETPMPAWVYTQPETGFTIRTIVWNDLLNKVRLHRLANGIPCNPGWVEEFEDEVCKAMKLSGRWCELVGTKTTTKRGVSFSDVTNFLRVLSAWMPKKEWVDQQEAERRAAICAACPHNVEVSGCSACSNIVGTITGFLGKRATGQDAKLKGCNVCGCSNRAQVHVPIDVLRKGITPKMEFPDACWKKA
jgi:hypothetical protein